MQVVQICFLQTENIGEQNILCVEHEVIYELSSCHFCRVQSMVKSFLGGEKHAGYLCSVNQICVIPYSRPIYCFGNARVNSLQQAYFHGYLLFWINVGVNSLQQAYFHGYLLFWINVGV